MKRAIVLLLFVALFVSTGCLTAPFVPPLALIYADIEAPLDLDASKSDVSKSNVRGEATCYCILGLVSFGDCGAQTAANDAGIKTIDHVDYKYTNVLGIYQATTVFVYGKE